jgi:hypothetical protein
LRPDGAERRHVEGAAHARPAAADGSFASGLAAVLVDRSKTGKRGDQLGRTVPEFGHMGHQGERGDVGHARRRDEQPVGAGRLLRLADGDLDQRFDRRDAFVEDDDQTGNVGRDIGVEGLRRFIFCFA